MSTTLRVRYFCFHFTDEETEAERLNNLPRITQLIYGWDGIQILASWLTNLRENWSSSNYTLLYFPDYLLGLMLHRFPLCLSIATGNLKHLHLLSELALFLVDFILSYFILYFGFCFWVFLNKTIISLVLSLQWIGRHVSLFFSFSKTTETNYLCKCNDFKFFLK